MLTKLLGFVYMLRIALLKPRGFVYIFVAHHSYLKQIEPILSVNKATWFQHEAKQKCKQNHLVLFTFLFIFKLACLIELLQQPKTG